MNRGSQYQVEGGNLVTIRLLDHELWGIETMRRVHQMSSTSFSSVNLLAWSYAAFRLFNNSDQCQSRNVDLNAHEL